MPVGKIHMLDFPVRQRGVYVEAACGLWVQQSEVTRDPDVSSCWRPGCCEARREMKKKQERAA